MTTWVSRELKEPAALLDNGGTDRSGDDVLAEDDALERFWRLSLSAGFLSKWARVPPSGGKGNSNLGETLTFVKYIFKTLASILVGFKLIKRRSQTE